MQRHMRVGLITGATILIPIIAAVANAQAISPDRVGARFCWLKDTRFENDAKLDEALQYFRQAKAAGYTGVVLANSKWFALPGAQGGRGG
ncbi:MAG: hypothetical protein H8E66_31705 [Planctomycetes bacterium]|nr:hypothetical protein [Planctomycetota bacterium]